MVIIFAFLAGNALAHDHGLVAALCIIIALLLNSERFRR